MDEMESMELFNKHQEFLSKLTPEERKQYDDDIEETKKKLEHCIEGGISISSKVKIEDFLYLKELKIEEHINKYLIKELAFHSEQNIILRYLLIEAGLNNQKIEDILKETKLLSDTKFYNIPNNLEEFNIKPKCYIKEEERLTPFLLNFKLYEYGILTPEYSSRRKIEETTDKIIVNEVKSFIKNFSTSFEKEIQAMLDLNKTESLTIDKFYDGIETNLKFFIHSEVVNEFNKKITNYRDGYIYFLNEMYWLGEDTFKDLLKAYLYFPNLLLSLTKSAKEALSLAIDFANKQYKELNEAINQIKEDNMSTVFVEGIIDKKFLDEALNIFEPELKNRLVVKTDHSAGCNWVSGRIIAWELTKKDIKSIGIFDVDPDAKEAMKKADEHLRDKKNRRTKTIKLPPPNHLINILSRGINFYYSIDQLITPKYYKYAAENDWLEIDCRIIAENKIQDINLSFKEHVLQKGLTEDDFHYLEKINIKYKIDFCNRIINLQDKEKQEALQGLIPLLNEIKQFFEEF